MLPIMLGGKPPAESAPPVTDGDALLLEDGTSFLLLESGDKLLLEA